MVGKSGKLMYVFFLFFMVMVTNHYRYERIQDL